MNSKTIVYWSEVVTSFFDQRPFLLAATEKGICRILWPDQPITMLQTWMDHRIKQARLVKDLAQINKYIEPLEGYFQGKTHAFSSPLDLYGTTFQVQVWKALLQIPYGQTRSYAEIAESIGNPKAVRAVGTATGSNPIPMIIPCHRVIGKNKKLIGFGGGLTNKKKLLHLEGYEDYVDQGHSRYQF